jgi:CDP-diacylglycerol---glycerol-3-phosphate 3-phosphatidyltransferase
LSIANYLTFVRIVISPIFLLVYLYHDFFGVSSNALPYVLLVLLGINELSDAFDGYFARKYNQVTDFGKIVDPMADSLARLSYFLTFTAAPVHLPLILIFIFLYRDTVISTLRTICALKGFALAARTSGKIKAVIQAIAAFIVVILMIFQSSGQLSTESLQFIATCVVSVAAVYSIYSGMDYIYSNREYLKKALKFQPTKS